MGRTKKEADKFRRQILPCLLPILVCIAVICVFLYALSLRMNAEEFGGNIGSKIGSVVGTAVGSFEGITEGREAGIEAGIEDGLSAEDTEVEIANTIHQVQKLEVLVASVELSDFHTIGENYAALYLLSGQVIFSVDLSQAEIHADESNLYITLPEPTPKLSIDPDMIEKAAVYQKQSWTGTTEYGMEAFRNTYNKLNESSAEDVENYSNLLESAEESAITQVTNLAQSAAVTDRAVHIEFVSDATEEG